MKFALEDYGFGIDVNLVISANEFLKICKDENYKRHLMDVVEMYTSPHCFTSSIDDNEIEAIKLVIKKNSKIVFSIHEDYVRETYVVTNGKVRAVRWTEDGGETYYLAH